MNVKSRLILRSSLTALVSAALIGVTVDSAAASPMPGDLDPTFGVGGRVVTDFGTTFPGLFQSPSSDWIHALALQPDGSILGAGYSSYHGGLNRGRNFALVRYDAEGDIDTTFGSEGGVMTDLSFGGDDMIAAIRLQPDQKIIAAGCADCFSSTLPSRNFAVARYNPNGSLDTTFGGSGIVVTDLNGTGDAVNAAALQQDGSIVLAGATRIDNMSQDFALARYLPNGTLDANFGVGGIVTTDFAGAPDTAFAILVRPDGRMVAAGNASVAGASAFALAQYLPDGTLDSTFGANGRVLMDIPDGTALAAVLQSDGRIVTAGQSRHNGLLEFTLTRHLPDGTLDPSFGSNGVVVTDQVSTADDAAHSIALQPDGKIIAGGLAYIPVSPDFALVRYLPNGSPDPSFGVSGIVTTDFGGNEQVVEDVLIQPDGKIVAGGMDKSSGLHDFALARYENGPIVQDLVLQANADTYVKSGQDNRNVGAGEFIRIRSDGSNRALVRFDQNALTSAIGSGTVLSAKLRMTIVDNGNNWGPTGRTVDAHRLLADWTEGNGTEANRGAGPGATWSCAADSNITNLAKDCLGLAEWEMGQPNNPAVRPWAQTPTDTQTINNGQAGIVEFDVTADVTAFVDGTSANYGWILRKTNEDLTGLVSFGTRESAAVAQLVVTYQF